jgi:hypothetical protein
MRNIAVCIFAITLALSPSFGQEEEAAAVWKSEPPENCPFQSSKEIVGFAFTARVKTYTKADTWYPSWSSDGHLYSPWTDGSIAVRNAIYGLNWPILGPFPGFRISKDFGKTWEDTPHTCEPGIALFPEPEKLNGPVLAESRTNAVIVL